jgi:hypothetical protein
MTNQKLDGEIAARRACIARAARTLAEAECAANVSEHTKKAMAALRSVLITERAVLGELGKYRSSRA